MTPRNAAEVVTNKLFINGGGKTADRLMLVDEHNRDLGGWGFLPVVDQIAAAISDAVSAERERCAQVAQDAATRWEYRNVDRETQSLNIAAAIRKLGGKE